MEYCDQSSQGSNTNPAKVFFWLIILLITGGIVMFSLAHAVERHGEAVVEICSAPIIHQAFRERDQRQANVCLLPSGQFGIMICAKDGNIVTCFIKEKMKNLESVLRYLSNQGYQ